MTNKTLEEIRNDFINNINDETLREEYELFIKSPSVDSLSYMLIGEYTFIKTLIERIEEYTNAGLSTSDILLETMHWLQIRFQEVTDYYNDYITTVFKTFEEEGEEE
jgi:hypothetical protein